MKFEVVAMEDLFCTIEPPGLYNVQTVGPDAILFGTASTCKPIRDQQRTFHAIVADLTSLGQGRAREVHVSVIRIQQM